VSQLEQLQQELARFLVTTNSPRVSSNSSPSPAPRLASDFRASDSSAPSALAGLALEELQQARLTLLRKRRAQTKFLLPRTIGRLNNRYSPLFQDYAAEHHFSGFRAPLLDAVGFSGWLAAHSEIPEWLRELATWEAWPLRLRLSPWTLRWIHLRWRVQQLTEATWEQPPLRQHSWWLAYRGRRRSGLIRVL